jgi:hypothetical protein
MTPAGGRVGQQRCLEDVRETRRAARVWRPAKGDQLGCGRTAAAELPERSVNSARKELMCNREAVLP